MFSVCGDIIRRRNTTRPFISRSYSIIIFFLLSFFLPSFLSSASPLEYLSPRMPTIAYLTDIQACVYTRVTYYILLLLLLLYIFIIYIILIVPHEMICTGNGTTGNGIYSNRSRRKRSTVVVRVAKVQVFVISPPLNLLSFTHTHHAPSLFSLMSHSPEQKKRMRVCVCVCGRTPGHSYTSATPLTPSDLRLCDLHFLCTILFLVLRTLADRVVYDYY